MSYAWREHVQVICPPRIFKDLENVTACDSYVRISNVNHTHNKESCRFHVRTDLWNTSRRIYGWQNGPSNDCNVCHWYYNGATLKLGLELQLRISQTFHPVFHQQGHCHLRDLFWVRPWGQSDEIIESSTVAMGAEEAARKQQALKSFPNAQPHWIPPPTAGQAEKQIEERGRSTRSRTTWNKAMLSRSRRQTRSGANRYAPSGEKASAQTRVALDVTCASIATRPTTLRQSAREKESRASWRQVNNAHGFGLLPTSAVLNHSQKIIWRIFFDSKVTKRRLLTSVWRRQFRIWTQGSSRLQNRWNRVGDPTMKWWAQLAPRDQTKVYCSGHQEWHSALVHACTTLLNLFTHTAIRTVCPSHFL